MTGAKATLAVREFALAAPRPAPRVDLRSGMAVSGRVAVAAAPMEAWIETVSLARESWNDAGKRQPLSARAPLYLFEDGAAQQLDALLRGAGFPMRGLTIEFDEMDVVAGGGAAMTAIERLRARGWGVGLVCAPDCPLAIGQRTRSLFTEMLAQTPEDLSPALVMADPMQSPMTRRLRAAQNGGLATTALNVKSPAHAGLLVALGFDRGEGPGYPG